MLLKLKFIIDFIESHFNLNSKIAMAAKIGKNGQSVSEHRQQLVIQ
jgi:hypothetical protein